MKTLLDKFRTSKKAKAAGIVLLLLVSFWAGSITLGGKGSGHEGHDHGDLTKTTDEQGETVWTCSMHPQIKMPKPGQCPICFMDLIPLESGSSGDDGELPRLTMSENARVLAGIVTAPVVRRGASTEIAMTGKVELDETKVEMITARIGGRIDRLFVDFAGVPVKKGGHLAEIYSPELVSVQRELLEAAKAVNRTGADAPAMVRQSVRRTFEAAKKKLVLLGFSNAEVRAVLNRGTTSDHMTIRASQEGIVLKKLVEEGTYVATGTPLFHIADLKNLWVLLDAYESDLVWLRLGQEVDFTVEAWPGETFSGTVSFIDPMVNPQTRTVKVRVDVENPDLRLKPDMFVRAKTRAEVTKSGGVKAVSLRGKWISPMHPQIVKDGPGTCDICGMPLVRAEELGYMTSGLEDVDPLLIPATAPLLTGERAIVYVRDESSEDPTYEGREVVLGPRVGDAYVVKSGLSEGEKVVVKGAFKIDGELQIRAKPSMMSPAGGVAATGHAGHGSGGGDHVSHELPEVTTVDVPEKFLQLLQKVYDGYFAVGEALAADDLEKTKEAMDALDKAVAPIEKQKGKPYEAWRTALGKIRKSLEHRKHVASLADARELFGEVSKQVIVLQRHYGNAGDTKQFLAFCPMAFNNAGAYWLQNEEQIANPYFGASMLRCGEIRETYGQEN
jgi:Cu(I)/Ag(I) efflux system membrane fusion protein